MIHVAVIGTGNISHAHIPAWLLFPERAKIVALVDIIPGKAQKVKEEFGLDSICLMSARRPMYTRRFPSTA